MFITSLLLSLCLGIEPLKRPHLTEVQGYVESNMNSKAIGKVKEKGAWQVREKYWGKVPRKLIDQAKQAERILDELLKANNNNLHTSVMRYNGAGIKARSYANKIRKRTFEKVICFV